ncbi:MAG: outer membrane beta-barrel protein [Bacteroidales bacterium]|nr:outer membrane beta-barrel protein [Bacteroidales bacterium]
MNLSSGINFSTINYNSSSGKWQSLTGPVNGVSMDYNLTNFLSIRTGIDYLSISYKYKNYYNPQLYLIESSFWPGYFIQQEWRVSYLRFPLSLSFRTPTRLSFYTSAGYYFSSLLKNHVTNEFNPPDKDQGLIFIHGLSYHFENNLKVFTEVRYSIGKEEIKIPNGDKNGTIELSLGLGYQFPSSSNKKYNKNSFKDSLNPLLLIEYTAGSNMSIPVGDNEAYYQPEPGICAGFSFIIQGKGNLSLITGIEYHRRSYSLQDSSSLYYYYSQPAISKYVDAKTSIDYLTVPISVNFSFGNKTKFYWGIGLYDAIRINARVTGITIRDSQSEAYVVKEKLQVYDNIKDEFNNNEMGWLLNAGAFLPVFRKYRLDIGLRYQSAFNDIFKQAYQGNIRLNSINMTVGFIIPII